MNSIRLIVEGHAQEMKNNQQSLQPQKKALTKAQSHVIGEIDGSMVPTVKIDSNHVGDKRKARILEWREARLALAQLKGTITSFYSAAIDSVEEAGDRLKRAVESVAYDTKIHAHCVGDGALWIAEQVERVFGQNGSYLIDFYHLSQYLSAAAQCCAPSASQEWLHKMQQLMKDNKIDTVINELQKHLNEQHDEHVCAATKCYQYMSKRMRQFNYKDAIEQGLPIGSGEVESAHRSIIQKRLKIAGAWWLEKNANSMLAMRTLRANGFWDNYWNQFKSSALAN